MDVLRAGDTLVVWRLDRLGRSLSHLVELVERLEQGQIALQSLQEQIDTSGSAGRLVFHLFASLAEFERGLLRERTLAGLASARARGRLGGRPHKLSASEMAQAHALYVSKAVEVAAICQTFGISKSTFYRYLNIGNWPDDRSSSSKRG
jgi:DNA invertase Pin-like site-specific DNA recombinase